MVVYDEAARPRIVAQGFDESHAFAQILKRYAGSVVYWTPTTSIRWESFDATVILGDAQQYWPHLRVIQIGGSPIGYTKTGVGIMPALNLTSRPGDELEVPDDLPADLRELIKDHLLPLVRKDNGQPSHPWRLSPNGFQRSVAAGDRAYWPLIRDLDGYALAAWYRPPNGAIECVYLPDVVTDIDPWLRFAFEVWAEDEPDVFPAQPEWTADPTWMTRSEIAAAATLEEQRAEMQRVVQEQQRAVDVAEGKLRQAGQAADGFERLLLTAWGQELVDVVTSCLQRIGFEVTNVDAKIEEGQAKKEDLRVAIGNWVALCEAKGYTKGGKLNDIGKLQGYATLFAAETGSPPNALWYVVNQYRKINPSARGQLLTGADEYLESFAEQGGLAVDTRHLFWLWKQVDAAVISQDEARALLIESAGRFTPLNAS